MSATSAHSAHAAPSNTERIASEASACRTLISSASTDLSGSTSAATAPNTSPWPSAPRSWHSGPDATVGRYAKVRARSAITNLTRMTRAETLAEAELVHGPFREVRVLEAGATTS